MDGLGRVQMQVVREMQVKRQIAFRDVLREIKDGKIGEIWVRAFGRFLNF